MEENFVSGVETQKEDTQIATILAIGFGLLLIVAAIATLNKRANSQQTEGPLEKIKSQIPVPPFLRE
jgi:hypothetical protein